MKIGDSQMNYRAVTTGGKPIVVQLKRNGNGLKVSQGDSYLLVSTDEIELLAAAMREVSGA
jgi:hypothetical protein